MPWNLFTGIIGIKASRRRYSYLWNTSKYIILGMDKWLYPQETTGCNYSSMQYADKRDARKQHVF